MICYIFSASNSLAIGSLHEMNQKLIHSVTDLLWQAQFKSPSVPECCDHLEIKTFVSLSVRDDHMESWTHLWNAAIAP